MFVCRVYQSPYDKNMSVWYLNKIKINMRTNLVRVSNQFKNNVPAFL